jgi:type I restriction enzyme S subunit
VTAKLGELLRAPLRNGHSAKETSDPDGVRTITLTAVTIGDFSVQNSKITSADPSRVRDLWLVPGDILIERSNTPELVGTTRLYRGAKNFAIYPDLVIRAQLTDAAVPRFVELVLQSRELRRYFQLKAKGMAGSMPKIDQQTISEAPIPLPPLAEQKRIVAKIEELFSELEAGEESLRVARRQLGVYRQSLLKQAFEGHLTAKWRTLNPDKLESPAQLLARIQSARQARYEKQLKEWERDLKKWEKGTQEDKRPAKPRKPGAVQLPTAEQTENLPELPKAWSWISLGNCAVEISDGPFGSNLKSDDYVGAGVRVVRLENIGPGYFIKKKESFISLEKYEKLKRHTVRPGDIVVASFINDAVRAALIPPSIEYAVNKADCFQVHCFGDTISADFLVRCFGARYFFKQLEQLVHGVGRPRINTTQLGEAFVPLCSLPEQQEIVRLLDEQFEVIERNEREIDGALRQSEALRQAILQKAFTGRLVPQSPSDEPATTLLARLRAERAAAPASKRKPALQP